VSVWGQQREQEFGLLRTQPVKIVADDWCSICEVSVRYL